MKHIKIYEDFINEGAFGLSINEVIKEVNDMAKLSTKFAADIPKIAKEIEQRQKGKIKYTSMDVSAIGNNKHFTYSITFYTTLTPEESAERSKIDNILPYSKRPNIYEDPTLYYVKSKEWAKSVATKYGWKLGYAGNIGDQFTFTLN
jgi:hypothetical protein